MTAAQPISNLYPRMASRAICLTASRAVLLRVNTTTETNGSRCSFPSGPLPACLLACLPACLPADDAKMDNLILDLDGDGEVSMDEFMAVLMKDNFWSTHAETDEAHLHPPTPLGKSQPIIVG